MKTFTIKKLSEFGWSVIDPNGNLYSEQPMTEADAQNLCDDLNFEASNSILFEVFNP